MSRLLSAARVWFARLEEHEQRSYLNAITRTHAEDSDMLPEDYVAKHRAAWSAATFRRIAAELKHQDSHWWGDVGMLIVIAFAAALALFGRLG